MKKLLWLVYFGLGVIPTLCPGATLYPSVGGGSAGTFTSINALGPSGQEFVTNGFTPNLRLAGTLTVNGTGPNILYGDSNQTNALVVSGGGIRATSAMGGLLLDATNGNLSVSNQVIAQGWQNFTNLFSGQLFPTGTNYNLSLSTNLLFSEVSLASTKNGSCASLTVIATGTVTVTNPASWYASDGLTNRTLTNGNLGEMIVKVIPGFSTNFNFSQYWHP